MPPEHRDPRTTGRWRDVDGQFPGLWVSAMPDERVPWAGYPSAWAARSSVQPGTVLPCCVRS